MNLELPRSHTSGFPEFNEGEKTHPGYGQHPLKSWGPRMARNGWKARLGFFLLGILVPEVWASSLTLEPAAAIHFSPWQNVSPQTVSQSKSFLKFLTLYLMVAMRNIFRGGIKLHSSSFWVWVCTGACWASSSKFYATRLHSQPNFSFEERNIAECICVSCVSLKSAQATLCPQIVSLLCAHHTLLTPQRCHSVSYSTAAGAWGLQPSQLA